MHVMKNRFFIIAIGGFVAAIIIFTGSVFVMARTMVALQSDETVVVEVRLGEGLSQFLRRVHREGSVSGTGFLRLLAMLRGDSRNIKAGEYAFQGRVSPKVFLDTLVDGKARFLSITIPDGFSLKEIAARVEATQLGSAEEFLRLTHDRTFIDGLGLPFQNLKNLEGLIFPETYFFSKGLPVSRIISNMVSQYRSQAHQILEQKSSNVKMSPYEALIMASIIEKETGLAAERPTISGVFHNRLRKGMRLDSDPTVIYGVEGFTGNLTRKHLRTYTPYNTYKIYGLPPTPIASPGLDSIRAAVAPEKVSFLFFVGKGDGSHFFSSDLKTHNKAVWEYQKKPALK